MSPRGRARISPWSAAVALACIALAAAEGHTSDKGLKSEMVGGAVTMFCETSVAVDIAPIVRTKKMLMIAKMSQESYASRVAEQDAQWRALMEKHKDALARLSLTPRLAHVDATYVRVAAEEAWRQIRARCPAKHKKIEGGPDLVEEFLARRIPELRAPTPANPPVDPGP